MKQLQFPPPWSRPLIDLFAKLANERKREIKINYHFCGRKL